MELQQLSVAARAKSQLHVLCAAHCGTDYGSYASSPADTRGDSRAAASLSSSTHAFYHSLRNRDMIVGISDHGVWPLRPRVPAGGGGTHLSIFHFTMRGVLSWF